MPSLRVSDPRSVCRGVLARQLHGRSFQRNMFPAVTALACTLSRSNCTLSLSTRKDAMVAYLPPTTSRYKANDFADSLVFSENDLLLATGPNGCLRLFDYDAILLHRGRGASIVHPIHCMEFGNQIRCSAWDDSPSSSGATALVSCHGKDAIYVYDFNKWPSVKKPSKTLVVNDGSRYVADKGHTCIAVVPSSSGGNRERTLLAASSRTGMVRVWDVRAKQRPIFSCPPRQKRISVDALCASHDGRYIYLGNSLGQIVTRDLRKFSTTMFTCTPTPIVTDVFNSNEGKAIVNLSISPSQRGTMAYRSSGGAVGLLSAHCDGKVSFTGTVVDDARVRVRQSSTLGKAVHNFVDARRERQLPSSQGRSDSDAQALRAANESAPLQGTRYEQAIIASAPTALTVESRQPASKVDYNMTMAFVGASDILCVASTQCNRLHMIDTASARSHVRRGDGKDNLIDKFLGSDVSSNIIDMYSSGDDVYSKITALAAHKGTGAVLVATRDGGCHIMEPRVLSTFNLSISGDLEHPYFYHTNDVKRKSRENFPSMAAIALGEERSEGASAPKGRAAAARQTLRGHSTGVNVVRLGTGVEGLLGDAGNWGNAGNGGNAGNAGEWDWLVASGAEDGDKVPLRLWDLRSNRCIRGVAMVDEAANLDEEAEGSISSIDWVPMDGGAGQAGVPGNLLFSKG
eukprot:g1332.t1